MDFADQGSEFQELDLQLALRQHATRVANTAIPLCEECRVNNVHVTALGTRFRYCPDCCYDLTGKTV